MVTVRLPAATPGLTVTRGTSLGSTLTIQRGSGGDFTVFGRTSSLAATPPTSTVGFVGSAIVGLSTIAA
jgi:hypothetical protein